LTDYLEKKNWLSCRTHLWKPWWTTLRNVIWLIVKQSC
jgi:hypothetical protein